MPAKKMRVEVYDDSGNRYTITFEGKITRDKALRVMDIVELLGGMPNVKSGWERTDISKVEKVRLIIERYFPAVWFSAKEVQSVYEKEAKETTSLSTISTYLSRLANRGLVVRNRNSNKVQYRIVSENLRSIFELESIK